MKKRPFQKVLVVDDEPDIRAYISHYLRKRCHLEVADAEDGETAIALARTFEPDVMLLDIQMSKLSGWDVIREVRQFNATVKIIIVTGKEALDEDERELLRRHVALYLRKPVILEQLMEKMMGVLGTDIPRSARVLPVKPDRGHARSPGKSHDLANIHARMRLKSEYFVSNYEQGYFKDRTEKELVEMSVGILKEIMELTDKADRAAAKIRGS